MKRRRAFKSAGARAQPKNNFIVHLSQNVREQRRSGGVGEGVGGIDREPPRGAESSGAREYGSVRPHFWQCRCWGYAEVEATGSNWRQLCWDVVWRLCAWLVQEGELFSSSSPSSFFQSNQDFCAHGAWTWCTKLLLRMGGGFEKHYFFFKRAAIPWGRYVRKRFFVWFSLSKFPPTWKGTLPLN